MLSIRMFSLGCSGGGLAWIAGAHRAAWVVGVGDEQGLGVLAVQQRQIHLRAQLIEVPTTARTLESLGPGGQMRIGS
jgi:hypothetical protein